MKERKIVLFLVTALMAAVAGCDGKREPAKVESESAKAELAAYYKLDDNAQNSVIANETGEPNGALYRGLDWYYGQIEPVHTAVHHVEGVMGGAIDFTGNAYPTPNVFVNLNQTLTEVLGGDYSVSYLCRASEFRGSILAASSDATRTLIDIATLFHDQSYFAGDKKHMIHSGNEVPERFKDQWALFTHRISQQADGVRVRLGINGHDYVDKVIEDFNLAGYGKNPNTYAYVFMAAYNQSNISLTPQGLPREGFKCALDEVRIYRGVLSDSEIEALCKLYGLTYEKKKQAAVPD